MKTGTSRSLIVIGGGIGGYTAAIRAARAGFGVTLVEKGALGGTCLNIGCIPTKSLLHHARRFVSVRASRDFGVDPDGIRADLATLMAHKDKAVARLVGGVGVLIRRNRIKLVAGTATFLDQHRIAIAESGAILTADTFVIATGSEPIVPPLPGMDQPGIITSDGVFSLTTLPERLTIIGGGVVGVEFAQIFSDLGITVTLIERLDRILAEEDAEIATLLAESLRQRGVRLLMGTEVTAIAAAGVGFDVSLTSDGSGQVSHADLVLVAVGRRPATAGLKLERAGIATRNHAITTDDRCRTGVSHIYAIGDARGGLLLAHKAAAEAECAIADLMGKPAGMAGLAIPRAVYTTPAVAAVGLTEEQARQRGAELKIGRFPFSANGKAIVDEEPEGLVKIIADAASGQILGISMIGSAVTELLGEATLAVQMELTLAALAGTIHAHPTLSEALVEAAHDALDGGAIHLPPSASAGVA